ncbi:Homeobox-leucine zipper protein ROC8 [Zostera marina]|uniref:Homeobox-leucine zipper protein ROC8 n=1 Tax=Zostera marina TaxID=29655 RepID=A0A0K9NSN9_ZOSMR|nr:Homeobox-leucine zipper protein ROC8 [Zostera marina]
MEIGGDTGVSGKQKKKKRYHRHTPRQIHDLEAVFKECPHPDEKQRMELSRDLGLEPKQIKFWFQNRRTQMKAQHERADNCTLRAENDRIRCENIAIREALKNIICPTCGVSPMSADTTSTSSSSFFDGHNLRLENAHLREQVDRVSTIASKYLGRPITQLPPLQPVHLCSLDLSIGTFEHPSIVASSSIHPPSLDLDLDLLPAGGTASSSSPSFQQPPPPPPPLVVSEIDRCLMVDIGSNAMEELIRLVQMDEPLWIKSCTGDSISLDSYRTLFPDRGLKNSVEASRDSGIVFLDPLSLVDLLVDSNKCLDMFPTIISKARTLQVLATGNGGGGRNGTLLLMYEEQQVLSPVVPTREFYFLRYAQQMEVGLWSISDVSVELSPESKFQNQPRKLPSGVIIEDMSNGCSRVTWVVHMEISENFSPPHEIYRDLVSSGKAFGAQRWVSTLKRKSERQDTVGGVPSEEGKISLMRLSQRMVCNFCSSLGSSGNNQKWTHLSRLNDVGVRVTVHRSSDPGQANDMVLSAATSIWVPVDCDTVFSFLRDERSRSQWDVLSNGNSVQEVAQITNGSNSANKISLLQQECKLISDNMVILQESFSEAASGSMVVSAPIDLRSTNLVMSGEDPSYIPLLPSGFSIVPDGRSSRDGSLITVAFQILVSSLPCAKINVESITTVNNLISTTVLQIKSALNCQ